MSSGSTGCGVQSPLAITVAIPTYRRERVLLDTVQSLLRLVPGAAEILVLDQTSGHTRETESLLGRLNEASRIRWLRLPEPSIPGAMNRGLIEARNDIVLFLDDDIVPFVDLLDAHVNAHRSGPRLVAGRVLQPWDDDVRDASWPAKQFASTESREIEGFMGGNFSLRRKEALELGGFDENFVRVAYHFEREFADRWRARGGKIHFCPDATIRHLKAWSGGTRTFGEHLTTFFPAHSVGAYYYLLRSQLAERRVREFVARPFRSVMTRHHLRRPWWIPLTLVAELMGMLWALTLYARGPRYCSTRLEGRG
jgi:GT2 family glycosyltransferase